jgi:hypothetical protein
VPGWLHGQVPQADSTSLSLREIDMTTSWLAALRILLLLLGGATSLLVLFIGFHTYSGSQSPLSPRLALQGVALVIVGGVCMIGVVISAMARHSLVKSASLRNFFTCAAFTLPAVDLVALMPEAGATAALFGHVLLSLIAGIVIALSIATAWLNSFQSADAR